MERFSPARASSRQRPASSPRALVRFGLGRVSDLCLSVPELSRAALHSAARPCSRRAPVLQV